ncbi:MAG: heme exporter protein D [Oleiphilaceae bacterium]|jgi:heme exporter protein D
MNFTSFESFLNMGGHGLYVWLSYGVGLLVFIIAFLSPILKRKRIIQELSQLQRRQQLKRTPNKTTGSIN